VMAPSTDAVMGAIPEANAGVGSAMNDVTRQVAGALGVAIIGSVTNAVFTDRMSGAVAALPPDLASAASDSVGAATNIGARLGGQAGDILALAARESYMDAFGLAALVGAALAIAGAIVTLRFMPPHHLPADSTEVNRDAGRSITRASVTAEVTGH